MELNFVSSCKSGVTEDDRQDQKHWMNTEVKQPASPEKYGIRCWTSEFTTNTQCTCDLAIVDRGCGVQGCRPKDGSDNPAALDKAWEFASEGKESDSRRSATDQPMHSSYNVSLCSGCRAVEQQCAARTVRPRSLEVTSDLGVNVDEGHRYENLERVFRNPARAAASGGCLNVSSNGGSKDDAEDVESESSRSSSSVSTPAGRVTSSASVDAAIGRTTSAVCRCNEVDTHQFIYNSVELDSVARNPDVTPGVSSDRCFREGKAGKVIPNRTAHCSRPSTGEVQLLNKDLLRYCSRDQGSASTPIDIVSAQRLPSDQRVGNLVSTSTDPTTAAGHSRELEPVCSGCRMAQAEDRQAARRRAYRVGLNLFNR